MNGFLNPQKILSDLNLDENMFAADFGCGSGGWVIPLAKIMNKGKVYAIDVQEEMLSALKGKLDAAKIFNVESKRKNLEQGSGIKENSLDLVLITNLLFQAVQKKEILIDAKNILKSGGKILIIDWLPDTKFGPQGERVSVEDVKEMAKQISLETEKEFNVSDYHWGLILNK